MKALARRLTTKRASRRVSTLTPASGLSAAPATGPGIRDVLDMRVGCWRPPVHVTLT